jgi:hypothetical protein
MGAIMCYVDFEMNDDGTATVFCGCGWRRDHATLDAAVADGQEHRNEADAADAAYAAAIAATA